ncbi:hypothetical protein H5410_056302 [Solanum commersonii]|uniref:Uncharacterized protein n=1 Tax=Solanum commersonii TaxID=4109 RepID=A0A9J5WMC1_SOLCO|nr:hypothetical protein H5410_056302 [Solanum commersonii]
MALRFPRFSQGLARDPTTRQYLRVGYTYKPKWKPSASCSKMPISFESPFVGTLWRKFLGLDRHLVHVAIPASAEGVRSWNNFLDVLSHPRGGERHSNSSRGFHPQTQSLWSIDMAHHHLAIAFIFLVAFGHMYRTNFGLGAMKDLLDAHIPPGRIGRGHKGLYDTINNSLHFQLGLTLASLGVITSLVAQHMYSLPAMHS